jgi:hypothetical protein
MFANFAFSLALIVSLLAISLIDLDGLPAPRALLGVAGLGAVGLLWSESTSIAAAADWLFGAVALSSAGLLVIMLARRRVHAIKHATWVACAAFGMLGAVFMPPGWTLRLGVAPHPVLHVVALAVAVSIYALAARSLSAAGR